MQKMLGWKRKSSAGPSMPAYPAEPPRPILKTAERPQAPSPTRIRFTNTSSPEASTSDARPQAPSTSSIPRARRSSRPISPVTSSFGSRSIPLDGVALATPPMEFGRVTTPPNTYISTMQQGACPPPSPYRPTNDPRRISTTLQMVDRPARHSSLFTPHAQGTDVPAVNIIPATPQDEADEFEGVSSVQEVKVESLDEAAALDEPSCGSPTLDVDLDFTPFQPLVSLPHSESSRTVLPDPLPPSPPFESFGSLPSLMSSHSMESASESMQSAPSVETLPHSSSLTSLMSFPDVEEALGSMLASLDDSFTLDDNANPGLGLGLDLPTPPSITAPLANLRKAPPPPLNLSKTNHRTAFYKSAKAAPNTPSSGVFIDVSRSSSLDAFERMGSDSSSSGSVYQADGFGLGLGDIDDCSQSSFRRHRYDSSHRRDPRPRDSLSLTSEASDDDLHTASIVSLTPVYHTSWIAKTQEEISGHSGEVGLAF